MIYSRLTCHAFFPLWGLKFVKFDEFVFLGFPRSGGLHLSPTFKHDFLNHHREVSSALPLKKNRGPLSFLEPTWVTKSQNAFASPLPNPGAPVPPPGNNFQNYFQGGLTFAIFHVLRCRYLEIISRTPPKYHPKSMKLFQGPST